MGNQGIHGNGVGGVDVGCLGMVGWGCESAIQCYLLELVMNTCLSQDSPRHPDYTMQRFDVGTVTGFGWRLVHLAVHGQWYCICDEGAIAILERISEFVAAESNLT